MERSKYVERSRYGVVTVTDTVVAATPAQCKGETRHLIPLHQAALKVRGMGRIALALQEAIVHGSCIQ